jgi:hypothetical protein
VNIWKFRGFSARFQGPKHNYTHKPMVYSVKDQRWTSDGENWKAQGLKRRKQDLTGEILICGRVLL